MLFPIGTIIVFGCVAGGYAMHHGNFAVLWQPNEMVIIFGSAIGASIISNPGYVLKGMLKGFGKVLKGAPFKRKEYIETLTFLYHICKFMKTQGMLKIEAAFDDPESSEHYTNYPLFLKNHHGVDFFNDYMRMITMGMENHFDLEDAMEKEIEAHHHAEETPATAITTVADSLPALGIVAAVLGVIQTMGSIAEPPEILGGLIGAALVGTFLGILFGYGLVGPLGASLTKYSESESAYYVVLKTAILSHVKGNAPAITVEFARKMIPGHLRPSFKELDELLNGQPAE
jgi:chemotaxis protein MotA